VCALDIAGWDLYGKLKRKQLHQLWNLDIAKSPITDFTIGIDTIENMVAKMKEKPWPIYKIKVGVDNDIEMVAALRQHTDAIFRVDANAGWSLEQALQKIPLLKELGVKTIKKLYCEPTGKFPHNPEPLPENIKTICREVKKGRYDLGIIVDPDVDRLALVQEDGKPFGEEYTLVAVADYILSRRRGNTVSNLSSTRALRDVTEKRGGKYTAAAVGEVNVVSAMKETKAVIGGEGNGGVIFPELLKLNKRCKSAAKALGEFIADSRI